MKQTHRWARLWLDFTVVIARIILSVYTTLRLWCVRSEVWSSHWPVPTTWNEIVIRNRCSTQQRLISELSVAMYTEHSGEVLFGRDLLNSFEENQNNSSAWYEVESWLRILVEDCIAYDPLRMHTVMRSAGSWTSVNSYSVQALRPAGGDPESIVHKNIFLKVCVSLSELGPSEPHWKVFVKSLCGSSYEKGGGKLLLSWRHWAPLVRPAQQTD